MKTYRGFKEWFGNKVEDGVKKKKEIREPTDVWSDLRNIPNAKIAEGAYNAFKNDENADLFIAVFKDKDNHLVCVFSKANAQKIKIENWTMTTMVEQEWLELKKNIDKKDVVISTGKLFYESLLGGLFFHTKAEGFNALENNDKIKFLRGKFGICGFPLSETAKFDDMSGVLKDQEDYIVKEKGEELYIYTTENLREYVGRGLRRIWIYCEDEDINRIWEWIYMDNIGFFGDDVLLIRVPRECEFNRKVNRDEDESVETLKFAVLHKPGSPEAYETPEIVRTCCKKYGCQYIDVYDREGLQNLINYNYIHASLADLNDVGLYQDILEEVEINKGQKKLPCFLFLKVCSCCDEIREGVFGLVNPDVWLETSFDVKEDSFEKAFYREFCNTGDISEAIIKARNKIPNSSLRFAYVLKGNPIILREFLNYHS
jgi:hypothetical protein